MRILQTVLALALSVGTAGVASAVCESKKCPASANGAAIDAVRAQIEAECVCDTSSKSTRKAFKKCAIDLAKAAKAAGELSGPCFKAVKKCSIQSTCGQPGKVACCQTKKDGSFKKAIISKSETKCEKGGKGSACSAFVYAADACTGTGGECSSVTTTSTSVTTTTSTSTTSTTLPPCQESCPGTQSFDFITANFGGDCGDVLDGSNATLADIGCGGLDIGGGSSTVKEGPVPNGAISRFAAVCEGDECTISPSTCSDKRDNGAVINCTDAGCPFGPPLPIPGPPATCVVNTFKTPASGTINTATGAATITIPLNSQVYLTGDIFTPCPYCGGTEIDPETEEPFPLEGSLEAPLSGTCIGGATPGVACTTTNSQGLTNECLPGGVAADKPCNPDGSVQDQACADGSSNLGGLEVTLANTTTSISTLTNPDGFFCPGQEVPDPPKVGCFGAHVTASTGGDGANCRTITVNGASAGPFVLDTPTDITLASAFCIPAIASEGGALVNLASNLPGPGAVALLGTGTLSNACPLAP